MLKLLTGNLTVYPTVKQSVSIVRENNYHKNDENVIFITTKYIIFKIMHIKFDKCSLTIYTARKMYTIDARQMFTVYF